MRYTQSPGLARGFGLSEDAVVSLRPLGVFAGQAARAAIDRGIAAELLGGSFAFAACEVFIERGGEVTIAVAAVAELRGWAESCGGTAAEMVAAALARCAGARPAFAGLDLSRPRIFGIINLSPDSFYGDSIALNPAAALARAEDMVAAGADVIDVGGASTRPGAQPVAEAAERARVLPVIEALARRGRLVSVDTSRASIMAAAFAAGASIVNDVSALTADPDAIAVVARAGACAVIMHMQGEPQTMQAAPRYGHAPYEISRYLARRVAALTTAGVPLARIAVDPGIGFGKNDDHIRAIFDGLSLLHGLGVPVMVGSSRKSFIGRMAGGIAEDARLPGSLAAVTLAGAAGVQLHRVHDAAATRQALQVLTGLQTTKIRTESEG